MEFGVVPFGEGDEAVERGDRDEVEEGEGEVCACEDAQGIGLRRERGKGVDEDMEEHSGPEVECGACECGGYFGGVRSL